jgi:hypothetical protein
VVVWNLADGQIRRELEGHLGEVKKIPESVNIYFGSGSADP